MDERTDAKHAIESSTRHMSDIARELSRRATPAYVSDRAKETALNKTVEWRDQIFSSPTALGIIGGTIGALIGRSFAKERSTRRTYAYSSAVVDERGTPYIAYARDGGAPYIAYRDDGRTSGGTLSGLTDRASDAASNVRDRAAEAVGNVRDRAGDAMANVRDHLPSTAQIERSAEENPMMVALGGLALGAVAALLLPVTRQERELLEPVKQRAGEAIGTLGDKLGDTVHEAQQKIEGKPQSQPQTQPPGFDTSLTITH
jgi:hypothetical protein